jgi:hypothetical protein
MALPRTALAATLVTALVACDTPVDTDGAVDCTIGGTEGRTLAVSVGDVATVSDPVELACLRLEATAAASRYLFVPANVTPRVEGNEKTIAMSLRASESGTAASAAVAASLGAPGDRRLQRLAALRDTRIEERIRGFETTIDFDAVRAERAARQGRRARGAAASVVAAEPPPVGSAVTIRVPNFDDNTDQTLCDNAIAVSTTVKAVGQHAVILQDNAAPSNGLTDTEFGEIAAEFDQLIYDVVTEYFGVPTDLDADERIFILYTPEVNKLSTPGSGSYVGGFFFSGDLLGVSLCAQSNETEIFYLLTADPTGQFGNEFDRDLVRLSTRGTIAHEFQHMINLGVRMEADFDTDQETSWLNEGLSHFAEELVGRRALGRGDLDELTWLDVWTDESIFLGFFYQNFARFESYLRNPQGSSATSDRAGDQLSYRGASWAFVRHLADHHSDAQGSVAAFTRALVNSPDTGIANLESRTAAPFEEQMRGWLIANWADDREIANLDPSYEYASWRMREAMDCFVSQDEMTCEAAYPLKVTSLSAVPAGGSTLNLLTGTGAYFLGTWSVTTPEVIIQLTGPNGQLVTGTGGRMFVLRVD